LRDASVYAFGSFRSGLYLPTADMDLVICSDDFIRRGIPKYNSKNNLYRFQNFLKVQKCAFDPNDIELITKAKVPLVKYVERDTGLKMDISFERMDGINAVKTFEMWKAQYPAMPILVTLVKLFLLMRGLHEPVNGGIGGFSVICLVVSMLQHNPHVESRNMAPNSYLGELLLEFFELYGKIFNYKDVAIQLNPPAYVSKVSHFLSLLPSFYSCCPVSTISNHPFAQ
jgi:non-canonical poly(A) RNA polymerase PAPD5/7